jgi:serine/threonine protein phosphatase 1
MGNHEECMLRSRDDQARHSWLTAMGGLTTIASYDPALERAFRDQLRTAGPRLYQERFPLPYDRFFAAMPDEHQEILDGLRFLHQTPDAVYVHAGFDADLSVEGQVADVVLWGAGFPRGYSGTQRVVYGHHSNAVRDGTRVLPRIADSTYGIDTVAAGVLTALRLPDGRLFQEPEPGATALAISLIRKTGSLVRGLSTRRWGRH